MPYETDKGWTCEEYVEECSQRKVLGQNSLHALSNALTVARIDLEAFISAGYTVTLSNGDSTLQDFDLLKELFSMVPFLNTDEV